MREQTHYLGLVAVLPRLFVLLQRVDEALEQVLGMGDIQKTGK
jgi:hypothetical protein